MNKPKSVPENKIEFSEKYVEHEGCLFFSLQLYAYIT